MSTIKTNQMTAAGQMESEGYKYTFELDLNDRLIVRTAEGKIIGACEPFPAGRIPNAPKLNLKIIDALVAMYIGNHERRKRYKNNELRLKRFVLRARINGQKG